MTAFRFRETLCPPRSCKQQTQATANCQRPDTADAATLAATTSTCSKNPPSLNDGLATFSCAPRHSAAALSATSKTTQIAPCQVSERAHASQENVPIRAQHQPEKILHQLHILMPGNLRAREVKLCFQHGAQELWKKKKMLYHHRFSHRCLAAPAEGESHRTKYKLKNKPK